MHTALFGKQPCRRRDNNILPGEYIRDNAHASGHIHKTNPFRVKREPLFFAMMTVHDPLHMHQGVCPAVCLICVLVSVSMCMLLFESMLPHRERPTQWAGFWTFHFQAWFNSQHAAALKRGSRAQQGSTNYTSFGDQQTGHIKAGNKKEQRHESSASLSLLCSVEQNVITEGNHPKTMMLQSFRKE